VVRTDGADGSKPLFRQSKCTSVARQVIDRSGRHNGADIVSKP